MPGSPVDRNLVPGERSAVRRGLVDRRLCSRVNSRLLIASLREDSVARSACFKLHVETIEAYPAINTPTAAMVVAKCSGTLHWREGGRLVSADGEDEDLGEFMYPDPQAYPVFVCPPN